MVEAGIAAAGGLLVVGAVLGNGVAAAVMDMSDGQTWLPDNDGSVVQINPATGQPEYRLTMGEGDELEITQGDGYLVVTNTETGVSTPIDLAGLVAGRSRIVGPEGMTLIGGGLMVAVEKEPGFVQVIDPVTSEPRSAAYRAGEDLADAVIDREGSIWLMTESGTLRELDFVPESGELAVSTDRPITGAGPDTRLVPHAAGVTVFAPDGGAILQIGTGPDFVQQVPALQGEVLAAPSAPATLAPASATDLGLVFVISDQRLLTIDVGGQGCATPLTPAVFEDKIYVPCGGDGVVMVLDKNGNRGGEDIIVPGGGDATLMVDDGRLYVSGEDDSRVVMVQQDGSSMITDVSGAEIPTSEPDVSDPLPPITTPVTTPPPVSPTTPPVNIDPPVTQDPTDPADGTPPSSDPDDDTTDPGDDPTTRGPGDGTTPGDEDLVPSDVTARVQPDGSVRVTWRAPVQRPLEYVVVSSDGAVEQQVPVGRTSAVLTGLTCGSDLTITVHAHHEDGTFAADDGTVTTPDCVNPPNASQLTPSDVTAARADDDVIVGWTPPAIAPDRYVVTGMGQSETVDGAATSARFADLVCTGEPLTFEVTAVHTDAGEHTATQRTAVVDECTVDPADLRPTNVTLTAVSGGSGDDYRLTWTAPAQAPQGYRITGAGVNQTAAAGATSVDLTIACAASVQLTLTANHGTAGTGVATSNTVTNTCTTTPPTTTPPTLTAPSDVAAARVDENTVRVTWTASTPAAQEYQVIPSSGGTVSAGTATTLDVDVTPGASYTFQVRAILDSQQSTSAASNAVTMPAPATEPGTPTGFTGSWVGGGQGSSELQVALDWTAPSDGGSPIQSYDVWWGSGSGTGSTTVTGPGTITIPCSGWTICTSGGNLEVTLTPVNGVGPGGTAHVTVAVTGVPTPQDGDGVLTTDERLEGQHTFRGTITYEPNATWAGIGGTCVASVDGGPPEPFDCTATTVVGQFSGARNVGMDGSVEVTITWSGGSATTSAYVSMAGEGYCYYESGSGQRCVEVASLDPGDPDVDVEPLPWQPPDVPNPPVVIAGVGMLLGAGTLRTLRALRRRGMFETGNPGFNADPDTTAVHADPGTEHERAR